MWNICTVDNGYFWQQMKDFCDIAVGFCSSFAEGHFLLAPVKVNCGIHHFGWLIDRLTSSWWTFNQLHKRNDPQNFIELLWAVVVYFELYFELYFVHVQLRYIYGYKAKVGDDQLRIWIIMYAHSQNRLVMVSLITLYWQCSLYNIQYFVFFQACRHHHFP